MEDDTSGMDFSGLGNIPTSQADYSGDGGTLTDASSTDILGTVGNLWSTFATPFAKAIAGTSSTPGQVAAGNQAANLLNGSGPTNSSLAQQAPLGLLDFLTGRRAMPVAAPMTTNPATNSMNPMIVILVVVIAALFFFRR